MNFFLLLNTKEDILMSVTKQLMDPIDFHCFFIFSYYRSQWGPSIVWLPKFFKISSKIFFQQKKEIHGE